MSHVIFIIVELLFLAVTHMFGGPPWTVIGAIAVVAQSLGGARFESLAFVMPSLAWLALSHATGNRELFFPYAMYLASCVALRDSQQATQRMAWLGPLSGAAIIAAFMVIRILQQATVRVLAVESHPPPLLPATLVEQRSSWQPRWSPTPASRSKELPRHQGRDRRRSTRGHEFLTCGIRAGTRTS
jgi:hypothetical protein